jgi:hypothetical protein
MATTRKLFVDYFENPIFTKTDNKDGYSIYYCKLNVHLANAYRYLIVLCKEDVFFIGENVSLDRLNWVVFQTRSLPENKSIKTHSYSPKHSAPFNSIITMSNGAAEDESVYRCSAYPVEITLLKSKDNYLVYPPTGRINSALETFNTIVELI